MSTLDGVHEKWGLGQGVGGCTTAPLLLPDTLPRYRGRLVILAKEDGLGQWGVEDLLVVGLLQAGTLH
jgi:hypothetical protein